MSNIPPLEERREKLCNCKMCLTSYEVLDFLLLIVDQKKAWEIDDEVGIAIESHDPLKTQGAVLATALAEYAFANGANPEMIINWFIYSYNKRSTLAYHGHVRPEAEKKLEDYKS